MWKMVVVAVYVALAIGMGGISVFLLYQVGPWPALFMALSAFCGLFTSLQLLVNSWITTAILESPFMKSRRSPLDN